MNIISEIVRRRRQQIKSQGHEMGAKLPVRRVLPLTPFGRDPFIICEIKRSSPSKGVIAGNIDAVSQAEIYSTMGIKSVSVLTESNYFSGSLKDLYSVKNAFPGLSILRKDFIVDLEDIEVSYRAGADAVLLIASMHDVSTLARLYKRAKSSGMEVLFEVHDRNDLKKANAIHPAVTGFNSRDLSTFRIDTTVPVMIGAGVEWNTRMVFESGISYGEDAALALSSGFSGVLVGEAVMRDPALIDGLKNVFSCKTDFNTATFWKRLYSRKKNGRSFVKICGITSEEDANYAARLGADILGFVFADSPRRAQTALLKKIRNLEILKTAVVVLDRDNPSLPDEIRTLLDNGLLDAVQFHGREKPEDCYGLAFPYYKAVRVKDRSDIDMPGRYRCPRVLVDTYTPGKAGGTGKRIPDELVMGIKENHPLWLAGGIGPDNVRDIVSRFKPELIDASSLLESSPGKKDHAKLKKLFEEIEIGTAL
jgi:indole-3-glycerol phosphate synthase/phosphoribosylanthranilate isomerase